MAFRSVHAERGTVFAHLPDLGWGQAWEAVWKVKPPPPLACAECWPPMYAKVSYSGLRFFAHDQQDHTRPTSCIQSSITRQGGKLRSCVWR